MTERPDGEVWPLAADETVLWRGRPAPTSWLGPHWLAIGAFAAIFAALAGGLGYALSSGVGVSPWWMVAGALAASGAIGLALTALMRARDRATRYLLTDRRAFVARPGHAVRIVSDDTGWRLDRLGRVRVVSHGGGLGSVFFARRPGGVQARARLTRASGAGGFRTDASEGGVRHVLDVGFERIADAERVAELIAAHR